MESADTGTGRENRVENIPVLYFVNFVLYYQNVILFLLKQNEIYKQGLKNIKIPSLQYTETQN